jgi:serine/threonine protein kinase
MSPPSRPVRFGPYLLLERVATGGMAEVFKAKKAGAGDFVAIKRILPAIAQDPTFVEMFLDEARIAKELHHPNIARILDMGQVGRSPYLVMEYVYGRDLRAVLQRVRERGERVPAPMACHVMSKVCEGLHHAHDKRDAQGEPLELVHRDVSPQNILVSTAGHVKLIDFGVAKAATKASKTHSGMLKGKLGYMSPEQVRGLPLDRRSDIFAAGIVLYELLTGERLFVGSTDFSTLERIRNVDIQPPSEVAADVPPELERIVLRAWHAIRRIAPPPPWISTTPCRPICTRAVVFSALGISVGGYMGYSPGRSKRKASEKSSIGCWRRRWRTTGTSWPGRTRSVTRRCPSGAPEALGRAPLPAIAPWWAWARRRPPPRRRPPRAGPIWASGTTTTWRPRSTTRPSTGR